MHPSEGQATTEAQGPGEPAPSEGAAWHEVIRFWFPDRSDEDLPIHFAHWAWRMRGGADAEIVARFADLTEQAAAGDLDS